MPAKELLFSVTKKDLVIETFRAGGKGGQKQNKTDSGVRIKHPASGAVAESREHAGQLANKRAAFCRLLETPEFNLWLRRRISEVTLTKEEQKRREELIAEAVDRQMAPENILEECLDDNGNWAVRSLHA